MQCFVGVMLAPKISDVLQSHLWHIASTYLWQRSVETWCSHPYPASPCTSRACFSSVSSSSPLDDAHMHMQHNVAEKCQFHLSRGAALFGPDVLMRGRALRFCTTWWPRDSRDLASFFKSDHHPSRLLSLCTLPFCGVCFLISVLCLEAVQSEVGFVFSMLADGPLAPGLKKSTLYTIQYAFNPNGSEQESTKTLCLARYPSLSHVKKHIASATLFLSATLTNISSPLLFSTSPCLCKTI